MNINGGIDWTSHTHHKEFVYPNTPIPNNILTSVVIGNYNHSDAALNLIERLCNYQKEQYRMEIIVSDTGSKQDQIVRLIDGLEYISQSDYCRGIQLKLVIVDKNDLRAKHENIHAFSFGINAAVKVADGKVIVSCDSSIITPPNFIFEMTYPHLVNAYRFVRAPLWDIKEEHIGLVDKSKIQQTPYDQLMQTIDRKMLKHSMGRPAWSINRKDFIDLGGCDEEMIYYGVADDDLVTRALMVGYENIMSKSRVIHIWHPENRHNNGFNQQLLHKHLQEQTWKINTKINWGKHDQLIEF